MDLKQLQGDICNAYVNTYTQEKVFSRAGPEFGANDAQILLIRKTLYACKRLHSIKYSWGP